ncbi:hypothetical protein, partial [Bordetella pertussis]|uniref:hypothetical protein n=1 Tax=Bordetella pertussis TaxID=520 RepID=UPI0021CC426B
PGARRRRRAPKRGRWPDCGRRPCCWRCGEQYSPWLAWLAVLLLVGAAPFLMGGTLPVLLRIDSSQLAVNCQ